MNSLDYGCAGCANSSDIHVVFNSFIQSLYDSVVKPHYYNPQAIAAIDCRGITGTSRFFKERPDKERPDKERPDKERPDKERPEKDVSKNGWNWRGNYSDYIHGTDSKKNGSNDYIQMNNLKSPRECCSEHELKRVSSCTSGCSIM
jgi:hypothetical protein